MHRHRLPTVRDRRGNAVLEVVLALELTGRGIGTGGASSDELVIGQRLLILRMLVLDDHGIDVAIDIEAGGSDRTKEKGITKIVIGILEWRGRQKREGELS